MESVSDVIWKTQRQYARHRLKHQIDFPLWGHVLKSTWTQIINPTWYQARSRIYDQVKIQL